MLKTITRLATVAAVLAVLVGVPLAVDAGRPLPVKAELVEGCPNCGTPTDDSYSVLPDTDAGYPDGNGVESRILNNNSVYTLDTLDTLDKGLVGAGTRYMELVFFSPVEGQFPGHILPPCWQGDYTQMQAVNWSVFTSSKPGFTKMEVGQQYPGFARMDFNVRDKSCDRQTFRYFLRWYNVCIERQDANSWHVTSGPCGAMVNYGEANLQGQGGRKKETVDYGDWRVPFKLLLTAQ